MSPPVEDAELSLLVPLGFIALTVWTASWGSSFIRLFSGSAAPSPPADAQPSAKEGKQQKKKGKKSSDALSETPVETTPVVAAKNPTNDRWRVLVLIVSWALFIVYLASDYGMGQMGGGGYDPYKILKVPETVSKTELKKLYRELSMEYHPDRLAGKPESERAEAEKRFVQISKAYKTLTTEELMNNWLQYGHPDGPRSVSVNVAIPAWMKKQENAGIILLVYLGIFAAVGYYFKNRVIGGLFDEIDEANGKPKAS